MLLSKTLKVSRPAVIFDVSNKAYTGTVAAGFKERFIALGGGQVNEISFNSKEKPDLLNIIQSARTATPDAVFIVAGALDSAMLIQQLRKAGSVAPVFISEWAGTNEFLKSGGAAVAGVRIYQHFNASSTTPAFISFKESYTKRFGDAPPFAATYSYEALSILAEALRKNSDPLSVKQTIIEICRYKGLQGDIELDTYGDPKRSFFLMQVVDGAFALVK